MRRLFWSAVAGGVFAVQTWRRCPYKHTEPPCKACAWDEPWGRWRMAAQRRANRGATRGRAS